MKITLFCSDSQHPVNSYIQSWAKAQAGTREVEIVQKIGNMEKNNATDKIE